MLTQTRLRELLTYDPDTGVFVWRATPTTQRVAGKPAGSPNAHGYMRTTIDKRPYFLHRLAFLYMTGAFPAGHCDHINRVKSDNRWANLRDVDRGTNCRNTLRQRPRHFDLPSGVHRANGRYTARGTLDRKKLHLGMFDTVEEAHAAYLRFLSQNERRFDYVSSTSD